MVEKMGSMVENGTSGVSERLLFEFLNDLFSFTS